MNRTRARSDPTSSAWFAFVAIQVVAVLCVAGEISHDVLGWQVLAALAWVIALAPWVWRLSNTYARPHVDHMPG